MSQKGKRKIPPGPGFDADLEDDAKAGTSSGNDVGNDADNSTPSPEKKSKLAEDDDGKKLQDEKDIMAYLDETFDIRQNFITLEQPRIAMVKETYPQLFTGKQLVQEFQRIHQIDIDETIRSYCAKYAKGIIEISRGISGSGAILRRAELAKQENVSLAQYWDMVSALCLIPVLLRENLVEMVQEADLRAESIDTQGKVVPTVLCRGGIFNSDEFYLVAEEDLVQEFEEFTLAYAALFACYYVFNMEYPRTLVNSYTFIQREVLDIRESTPIPLPVKHLMNKLQRWRKHNLQE